jgi:hypothetical protein
MFSQQHHRHFSFTRRTAISAAILAAGIAGMSANLAPVLASAAISHPGAGAVTGPRPGANAAHSPLGLLPNRIAQLGTGPLAAVYGGLMVTHGGTRMNVYLTSLSPRAERLVRAAAGPVKVSFLRTPHTRRQLLAVHAKITGRVRGMAARGIRIVSWFPGVNGDGMEHIGVVHLTAVRARTLRRLLGAGNIVLRNVAPADAPVATSRNNDFSPWDGGDNLTSNGFGCTSGVGINYAGHQYMLTAAHCYQPGWSVYNALAGQPGTFMGTEQSRDVSSGGDDTALINMTPNNKIWTGIIGHPLAKVVAGATTNPDGDTVCNEGAYSGEVCSTVQNNFFGCISVSGYTGISGTRTECNLVESESSGIANQEGDSGAPMIRYIGSNLEVTGIVSAGSGPVACQFNVTTCFQVDYYTAINEILSTEYPGSTIN